MRLQEAIRDELFRYREAGWPHLPVSKADALLGDALQVLPTPDSELRDVLAMTACETLIEGGNCSPAALKDAFRISLQRLHDGLGESGTDSIFGRSFSALVLASLLRRDCRQLLFSKEEWKTLFSAACTQLSKERDLRGYVKGKGWAHALAHFGDLFEAAAHSPFCAAEHADSFLSAMAPVTAESHTFFCHFEYDRLLRAVSAFIQKGVLSEEALCAWITTLPPIWAWKSGEPEKHLLLRTAMRFNRVTFLRALFALELSPAVQNAVRAACKELPE